MTSFDVWCAIREMRYAQEAIANDEQRPESQAAYDKLLRASLYLIESV